MKRYSSLVGVVLLILMISGCSYQSSEAYISKRIGMNIPNAEDVEETDTHGGFHGDGQKTIKLKFNTVKGNDILSRIEKSERWNRMPLTENLYLLLYGGVKGNIDYSYNLAKEAGIPEIENGYWYFKDRHSDSKNTEDDKELFNRYSFNFTIAMYDIDSNTLYYFEFDT